MWNLARERDLLELSDKLSAHMKDHRCLEGNSCSTLNMNDLVHRFQRAFNERKECDERALDKFVVRVLALERLVLRDKET